LDESAQATGTVVIIDVLRAFTSACYAFGAGAQEIILASEVDEAFALRLSYPDALLMGEVGGGPIAGFDFSNSPAHFVNCDLSGRRLIQRTSNGTQGVIRATSAGTILAASFVCAGATVRFIRQLSPELVTFVITGWHNGAQDPSDGDEDAACADYIEEILTQGIPDPTPFLARVLDSPTGKLFQSNTRSEYPATDLSYCTQLDHFDFALVVERQADGLLLLHPVTV